jgi:hypothetical protein
MNHLGPNQMNYPKTLTHLELVGNLTTSSKLYHLPETLAHLEINSKHSFNPSGLDHLPPTLTHLIISGLSSSTGTELDHLPPTLIHLTIHGNLFNSKINKLPKAPKYFW